MIKTQNSFKWLYCPLLRKLFLERTFPRPSYNLNGALKDNVLGGQSVALQPYITGKLIKRNLKQAVTTEYLHVVSLLILLNNSVCMRQGSPASTQLITRFVCFRDIRPEIRSLCISEIGIWMKEYR